MFLLNIEFLIFIFECPVLKKRISFCLKLKNKFFMNRENLIDLYKDENLVKKLLVTL